MSKTIAGTTTQFLYDGLNPIEELNGSNGTVATMLTGLNVDEYFERSEPACCGALSYLTDALGSTQSLVDSSGNSQAGYQYDPFGDTFGYSELDTTNSYQFTGREDDGIGTGVDLYYYRGRYYNAAFQRFISQDPIDFAGSCASTSHQVDTDRHSRPVSLDRVFRQQQREAQPRAGRFSRIHREIRPISFTEKFTRWVSL